MTEELKQKAEEYTINAICEACNQCQSKGYIGCDKYRVGKEAYIAGATEATKQLQSQLTEKDKQIEELKEYNKYLKRQRQGGIQKQYNKIGVIREQQGKIKQLESQIGKLIDFILSKTECCDVCPMTDTCINSEGTCPYAGILAKGEEEVTREWLMQFISKEIKEK